RDCLKSQYECWLLEERGQIAGYIVFSIGAGESHLLNVCVESSYRRQGIAKILLKKLYSVAFDQGAEAVFLEVRPSNEGAVDLYRSEGFEQIGVRKGYYPGQPHREDAWIFRRPL
ncbi:MAG TPA: ribosomal protein S18-alanine N-acetyltransferase, partial [Pseudomonadales bacterium]|nr:ribosomal protein S18-alanine N-acetyltransferase [Pseudomonadales bacterium]